MWAGVRYAEMTLSRRRGEAGRYVPLSSTFAKLSFYKSSWGSEWIASNTNIHLSLQNKDNNANLLVFNTVQN